MSIDQKWISAGSAVLVGCIVGAVLVWIVRRLLGNPSRRSAVRAVSGPTATFLFWLSVVTGVVVAVAFTSPETLRPIPSQILAWLPRALVAGLIILAGYAGGGTISAAVSGAAHRAIGHRPAALERALRWGVMGAAVILALGNLGVETTSLQIIVAGVVFAIALAFALLGGLGGREVASHIASGRTLQSELRVGDHISGEGFDGVIVDLGPVVVVLENDRGRALVAYGRLLDSPVQIVAGT